MSSLAEPRPQNEEPAAQPAIAASDFRQIYCPIWAAIDEKEERVKAEKRKLA